MGASPSNSEWSGTMQLIRHGVYSGKSTIKFQPIIDMDPTNESCIYSALHFDADQT